MDRNSPKHLCKEDENLICQDINPQIAAEKYSFSDYNQAGTFIVTIYNLTLSDAGVYWCGTETREGDISYISLTTKAQISVIGKWMSFIDSICDEADIFNIFVVFLTA